MARSPRCAARAPRRIVTDLPEQAQVPRELRLGAYVVALQLTNQTEVEERAGRPGRIAGTPPRIQRLLVA